MWTCGITANVGVDSYQIKNINWGPALYRRAFFRRSLSLLKMSAYFWQNSPSCIFAEFLPGNKRNEKIIRGTIKRRIERKHGYSAYCGCNKLQQFQLLLIAVTVLTMRSRIWHQCNVLNSLLFLFACRNVKSKTA